MRVWKENGSLCYFLVNNDRNSGPINTSSTPATVTPTSTQILTTPTSTQTTPAVSSPAELPSETVTEKTQDDSGINDLSFPTVPCQNRFEVLSDNQDQDDKQQTDDSISNHPDEQPLPVVEAEVEEYDLNSDLNVFGYPVERFKNAIFSFCNGPNECNVCETHRKNKTLRYKCLSTNGCQKIQWHFCTDQCYRSYE